MRGADKGVPRWLILLPTAWLAWCFLAGMQSVEPQLSHATLKHFASSVLCFYLGCFCLGHITNLAPFWVLLFGSFILVLALALEQHFGGLAEARRYFFLYVYPHL